MGKMREFHSMRAIHLISALAVLLTLLSPAATPVYATTRGEGAAPSLNVAGVLPGWWRGAGSAMVAALGPYQALPSWWPPAGRVAVPEAQASVHHFDVDVPATATAGEGFPATIEAHTEDDSLVGITTTVTLATNEGESISPTAVQLISGTVTEDVTLTAAGVGKLVTAISGTITGQATITIFPSELDHIRINAEPNNGGAASGYPVEVGTHTMDIYGTFEAWAGCYDVHHNYCGDEEVNWEGTGVLAQGTLVPSVGISTTFTPAPILSGTGIISATPVAPGVGDSTGEFLIQAPRLIVSKSGTPNPVPAGTALGYAIQYANVGNAAAPNVYITETYDPNVSFYWANPWPTVGDNFWEFGKLEPGESEDLTIVTQVGVSLEPYSVLTNVVTVGGPRLAQYAYTETTEVTSTPDLTVTLSALPDPVNAGASLNYRIHYVNQGTAPVDNVRITATYDAHVSYVTASPPPVAGTDNVWDVGRVKGGRDGDIDITVVVDDYMEDLYTLTTSATINSDEVGPFTDYGYTAVHAPELEMRKTAASDPVLADDQLVYTLVYSNVGHMAASGLLITDAVPDNTVYASCGPQPCSPSNGIVTWEAGDLAAGVKRTATLVVHVNRNVDTGTALLNTARVRVLGAPTYSATARITTTVVSTPLLWLTMSDDKASVQAGDTLTYIIGYTNAGNGNAYGVRIVATPPSSQLTKDPECDPPSDCVLSGGKLIYDRGTVPGGTDDSVTMLVTVRGCLPAGARSIVASAVISTTSPGDPPAGNSARDEDEIATTPDLTVSADYKKLMPWPGKRVTYTVEYGNSGHIAATGVVITATKAPFAAFEAGASADCWKPQPGGRYSCQLGELDCSGSNKRQFVVTLPSTHFTAAMTNFDATFEIDDDGGSGDVFAADLGVPNLVIEDVDVDSSVWRGEPGRLVVTVTNTGTGWACGIIKPEASCTRGFALDLFRDPTTPISSYPYDREGECYVNVDDILPGKRQTATIAFTLSDRLAGTDGYCEATVLREIWLKVDNWDPDRYEYPFPDEFGLVPEYDEYDNVRGPIMPWEFVYLPLMLRND